MFDQDNVNGPKLNKDMDFFFFSFFEPFGVNGYIVMRPLRDECTIVQLSLDLAETGKLFQGG